MFPEFQNLMSELKSSDDRFSKLCDKHTTLDQRIQNMVTHAEMGTQEEIEALKKEKLLIKDQVYALLKKKSGTASA